MAIYILGRIIFGVYFIYSGFNHFKNEKGLTGYAKSKGVPSPRLAVLLGGAMLMLGGLGFLTDMYTQQSALILIIFLVPTTFIMHAFWKANDPMQKMSENVNFMKNLALIGALLMML